VIASIILALASLVTAFTGLAAVLVKLRTVQAKVDATHKLGEKTEQLVNDQLDRQLRYSQQLTGALIGAHIQVPAQEQPASRPASESGPAG